jgi:hypothetical protein
MAGLRAPWSARRSSPEREERGKGKGRGQGVRQQGGGRVGGVPWGCC